MDINIVILYIMCFSIVIFWGLSMNRIKKDSYKDFTYTHKRIDQLERDIDLIEKKLKKK